MKHNLSLFIFLAALFSMTIACADSDSKSVRDAARKSLPKAPPSTTADAPGNITVPTTSSLGGAPAGNVQHYTCPNDCDGGGGSGAGNCPVCGETLEHNQAWHNQTQQATPTPAPTTTTTTGANPATSLQTPEPAQNADGVWHYTCTAGCTGGGAGATACASCGKTLVHNTAYHN